MDVQYLHYHGLGAPDLVRNHVVGAQLGVMELDRLALHLVEPFESKLDNLVCPLTVFHSSFIEVGIHQLVEIVCRMPDSVDLMSYQSLLSVVSSSVTVWSRATSSLSPST